MGEACFSEVLIQKGDNFVLPKRHAKHMRKALANEEQQQILFGKDWILFKKLRL